MHCPWSKCLLVSGLWWRLAPTAAAASGNVFASHGKRLFLRPLHHPVRLTPAACHLRGGSDGDTSTPVENENSATSPQLVVATNNNNTTARQHELVSETVLYNGSWRRLVNRKVRLPLTGQTADFEVAQQRGTDRAVLVFVWHTATKTATLIREYMPAAGRVMLGLAAGMVEVDKHHDRTSTNNGEPQKEDSLIAAQCELEEECRLTGGREWIRLTQKGNDDSGYVIMDKYSTTQIAVYLCLDPTPIDEDHAKPRDETEQGMEVVSDVTLDELRHWIRTGQLTIVGSWGSLLALDKLRELGEIE